MPQFWSVFILVLSGIVLASIAAMLVRYFKDMRAARERVKSLGSKVIETPCGSIEYLRAGSGYPVLVVHGALGGFDQGWWLANGYDITKHQVISVSRFGYLRSPLPAKANLDMQADAFACLLDALKIQRAAVFAVSGGATAAIRFVARHPERVSGLILLSPDTPGTVYIDMPPKFVFDTLLRSDLLYWVLVTFFGKTLQNWMRLVPKDYVLTPEYKALIKKVQAGDMPISQRIDGMIFESYTSLPEFMASVTPASPYPLDKVKTPVLIIDALDDPLTITENVRELAEKLPNSRLILVPEGGHLLFGHVEEVITEIAQFIKNHAA